MSGPLFLTDDSVKSFLQWNSLIDAVEKALNGISSNTVVQPPRLILPVIEKNGVLLTMPAFDKTEDALGCKLVTSFKDNNEKGLPSIMATILLMDANTGKVKVVMEGTEITTWRTAAASVVGTKHLHRGEKKILAIIGAGTQGRIHALAMKHYFNFEEVRIWNRTTDRAKKLCEELGPWAVHYLDRETCVRGADVIVTATYAKEPVVMREWLKAGAHINAVGSGKNHHSELEERIYTSQSTGIYVDHIEAANKELKKLLEAGVKLRGEIGQIINKSMSIPQEVNHTIFQSLGMAVEDVVAAKLVYQAYLNKTS